MRDEPELPSDSAKLARLPHSGDVIADKYQLEKVIGASCARRTAGRWWSIRAIKG